MTELLAKQGYDMIGVDLSDSMLDIAMEKRAQSGHNILYLQQDMREFELYGTVGGDLSVRLVKLSTGRKRLTDNF